MLRAAYYWIIDSLAWFLTPDGEKVFYALLIGAFLIFALYQSDIAMKEIRDEEEAARRQNEVNDPPA